MEISIKDLDFFKASPTLIYLIKCIHCRDDESLNAVSKVSNVFTMAEHLQERGILKIIGKNVSCASFEIRRMDIINYLSKEDPRDLNNKNVDEVINYFKKTTGKTRISNKSQSNRKFISARLKEYSVQDLKDVIDLKFKQWNLDRNMRQYIRIETLFNETKFQGYIGELEEIEHKDFADDI